MASILDVLIVRKGGKQDATALATHPRLRTKNKPCDAMQSFDLVRLYPLLSYS